MKKIVKTIGIITVAVILLTGAYLLGTTQSKTEIKEVEKVVEVVPDDYISLDKCIPLEDVACCYTNNNGYLSFALKDIGNQLDNANNRSYIDIVKNLKIEGEK